MRTLVLTTSCLALALLLTSFAPLPWNTGNAVLNSGAAISPTELTLASGPLSTAEYADAH